MTAQYCRYCAYFVTEKGLPCKHLSSQAILDRGSDAARYKALGNGMAQPNADFVMRNIAKILKEERL